MSSWFFFSLSVSSYWMRRGWNTPWEILIRLLAKNPKEPSRNWTYFIFSFFFSLSEYWKMIIRSVTAQHIINSYLVYFLLSFTSCLFVVFSFFLFFFSFGESSHYWNRASSLSLDVFLSVRSLWFKIRLFLEFFFFFFFP